MISKTLIIAEAGVNHNGSEELAVDLVNLAFANKADIVKFQIFDTNKLVTKTAKKANYQVRNTNDCETQYKMLKGLELSYETHKRLSDHCNKIGIRYLATAFDIDSLRFLAEDIKVELFKISSGDLTNAPFLLAHARYGRQMIVSTGMATLGEIEKALGVLAFGLIDNGDSPGIDAFENAYNSEIGQAMLKQYVTLLHCTTEYPTQAKEVNLKSMSTMHTSFGLKVGFSDHSVGNIAPVLSLALGACVIEKHFTLDKKMIGPDHQASMDPVEFASFIRSIRQAEECLGDGIKRPVSSEKINRLAARRSLVALEKIQAGDVFTLSNLGVKRPGGGICPFTYWDWLDEPSDRNYYEGEQI